MVWQDIAMSICALIFSIALVSQIVKGFKTKKGLIVYSTSIPTFICLYIIAFSMFTLQLYYSASMNLTAGILWTILFIQKAIYK